MRPHPVAFLSPLSFPARYSHPLPRAPICRPRWLSCTSSPQSPPLPPLQRAAGDATARITHLLATDRLSHATALDLWLFCAVKGLSPSANPWDRDALLHYAEVYRDEERAARTRRGAAWEELGVSGKIRLLHRVSNAEGDVTYMDPVTGYTVFTYFGHLKRGDCCGVSKVGRSHRCRHCPYGEGGEVRGKMKTLMDRVSVVEYARRRAQEIWERGEDVATRNATREEFGVGPGEGEEELLSAEGSGEEGEEPGDDRMRAAGTMKQIRLLDENGLARKKEVRKVAKDGPYTCGECHDAQVVTCGRCNGWTYLFSPEIMKCPQCSAKGYHACMGCTPFRPPSRSSFLS